MKKRLIPLLLCLVLVTCLFPNAVIAAANIPTSIDAPKDVGVYSSSEDGKISDYPIGYSFPENLINFANSRDAWYDAGSMSNMEIHTEFDYKYNDGSWHYTSAWDTENLAPDPYNLGYLSVDGHSTTSYIKSDMLSAVPTDEAMLKSNTVYFRIRFVIIYTDPSDKIVRISSPWSDTVSVGKSAQGDEIKLPAPVITKAVLKTDENGAPYFEITNTVQDSVKKLNNSNGAISISVEYRKNGGAWITQTGFNRLIEVFDFTPENKGTNDDIKIDAATYDIRIRYGFGPVYAVVNTWSPYSNIIKVDMPSFYKGASKWAEPELDKAAQIGLITDKVKDNVSGNITREEFAEIVVKLYEVYTGKKAVAGNVTFSDTKNQEIFKAANLGMVLGVGNNKFAPTQFVTREQMATILFRTLKVINPTADFSNAGAAKFTDDKSIASYAKDPVYYCSKNSIILGNNNAFNPKGNSSRQSAIIVCTRAYELYTQK